MIRKALEIPPKDRKLFRWLKTALSKDKEYENPKLHHIYINGIKKEAVATSGFMLNLLYLNNYYDGIPSGYYTFKGKELIETTEDIGEYFDYKGLIERSKTPSKNSYEINKSVYNLAYKEDVINRIYKDYFKTVDGLGLNPQFLLDSISFVDIAPVYKVKAYYPKDNSPILIEFLDERDNVIALSVIAPFTMSKP